uniref:Uncharacterized protein n=1 Tax=Rhizophora mucronata TaxID=61149 RepID=A0A2P2J9D4_RHIMU
MNDRLQVFCRIKMVCKGINHFCCCVHAISHSFLGFHFHILRWLVGVGWSSTPLTLGQWLGLRRVVFEHSVCDFRRDPVCITDGADTTHFLPVLGFANFPEFPYLWFAGTICCS